jgi:mannose/fructose/N-acetylgalactosamine-specific phosphotransferase system component IIC
MIVFTFVFIALSLITSFLITCATPFTLCGLFGCYNIYRVLPKLPNWFTETLEVCTNILTPIMEIINTTFFGH